MQYAFMTTTTENHNPTDANSEVLDATFTAESQGAVAVHEREEKRKLARRIRAGRVKLFKSILSGKSKDHAWQQRTGLRQSLHQTYDVKTGDYDAQVWSGLFASLLTSERMRSSFFVQLRWVSNELSSMSKEKLANGETYVPFVVVGLGAHGSILLSEMLHNVPQYMQHGLGLDSFEGFGGQFLQMYGEAAAYKMNTPNTATGTDKDKNFLGPHAPLQLSDISSTHYGDNLEIGSAIAVNACLSGVNPMFGTRLISIEETSCFHSSNPSQKDPNAPLVHTPRYRLLIEIDGRQEHIFTDVINIASGIGNPVFKFEDDERTNEVIASRTEQGIAQLLSAEEFNSLMNDTTNPDIRDEFNDEEVLVVGRGTSSVTALETAFRMNTNANKSAVVRRGKMEHVFWAVGQKEMNQDNFMKELWARYYGIMDILGDGDKLTTIQSYAKKLEFVNELVFDKKQNKQVEKRRIRVTFSDGSEQVVDRVVAATGYVNDLPAVLDPLFDASDEGGGDINTHLDLLLDGGQKLIGKSVRGHSIFLSGPSALTLPEELAPVTSPVRPDYLSYPIPQALTNFASGTVEMARLLCNEIETRVPRELLQANGGMLKKYAFITGHTSELKREWSDDLDLGDVLRQLFSSELQNAQFIAETGTVFSLYITESKVARETRFSQDKNTDRLHEYEVVLSAHTQGNTNAVKIVNTDMQVLLAALNQPQVKQALFSNLELRSGKKDLHIKAKVGPRRKIDTQSILISQGAF